MSVIYFNLVDVYSLESFVSGVIKKKAKSAAAATTAKVEWSAASNQLPEAAGIYVIQSTSGVNSNSYIGVTQNMRHRFASRHEAVHHLGISQDIMKYIHVWRGDVEVWDSPRAGFVAANIPPDTPIQPQPSEKGAARQFSYFPMVRVDNGKAISVEHLLIRYYVSEDSPMQTNTNTNLAQTPFLNSTQSDIICYVNIAAYDVDANPKVMRFIVPKNSSY